MVFLTHMFFAFIVAVALAALISLGLRRGNRWVQFTGLFIIIFFVTWAAGIWIMPIGPAFWGTTWIPFLVAGIVVTLLLAALSFPFRQTPVKSGEAEVENRLLNIFFWFLLAILISVIVANYVLEPGFVTAVQ